MKDPVLRGGIISKAIAKSDVDWKVYRASSIPGPGEFFSINDFDIENIFLILSILHIYYTGVHSTFYFF